MSPAYDLIEGVFAHMTAQSAVYLLDRNRAFLYLQAAVDVGISWADAEQYIREYLATQGCNADWIADEVIRARLFLEPWLS